MSDTNRAIIAIALFLLYWSWYGRQVIAAAAALLIPQVSEKVVATYSATDIVTIVAAVGVLFSSVVTGIVTIIATLRNGQKTDNLDKKLEEKAEKLSVATQGVVGQLQEVHTLTNTNMTTANNKNDALVTEIKALKEFQAAELKSLNDAILELKTERGKKELVAAMASVPPTAQATPARPAAPAAPAAPVTPPVIVVENVTAENVNAETVRAGTLTTGAVEKKKS